MDVRGFFKKGALEPAIREESLFVHFEVAVDQLDESGKVNVGVGFHVELNDVGKE